MGIPLMAYDEKNGGSSNARMRTRHAQSTFKARARTRNWSCVCCVIVCLVSGGCGSVLYLQTRAATQVTIVTWPAHGWHNSDKARLNNNEGARGTIKSIQTKGNLIFHHISWVSLFPSTSHVFYIWRKINVLCLCRFPLLINTIAVETMASTVLIRARLFSKREIATTVLLYQMRC